MKRTHRILNIALALLAVGSAATAQQRLDIVLKDRSIASYSLDDISYMEVVEGASDMPVDGVWYLGWTVANNGSGVQTRKNGNEVLAFYAGPKAKWIKSATSEVAYDVDFDANGIDFGMTKEGATYRYAYQILAHTDEFLLLKQGTTRYYFYNSKDKAASADFVSYPTRNIYTDAAKLWAANIKGGSSASNITPMGKHFEKFSAASDADKEWLADPANQPDASYVNVGNNDRWTAKTIELYPFGTPVPADVNQHGIGNCCMCAVLASFAYLYPDWIKTIITKNGNNYTVKMYDPMGGPIDVVVDNKLLSNSSGSTPVLTGKNGKYNWATILEKALMKWETRFKCNGIGGIGTEHAAPPFTGNGASFSFDRGKLFPSEFNLVVDYALSNGMISVGGFGIGGLMCGTLETVTGHAFTVMYADQGSDSRLVMRNPWGNGDKTVDGKLMIPNDWTVLGTIDFRLVYPGAAAPYLRTDLGGYTPPKYRPTYDDLNPSPAMLKMYGVENYEPILPDAEDEEE